MNNTMTRSDWTLGDPQTPYRLGVENALGEGAKDQGPWALMTKWHMAQKIQNLGISRGFPFPCASRSGRPNEVQDFLII